MRKVIIIGSGPAGLTSAIYCARALLEPLVFLGEQPGGQLITTTEVENFPGFDSINGFELTERMKNQASHCGAEIISETVASVTPLEKGFLVTTTEDKTYEARAVIVATGASAKKLTILGGDLYWNNGISSCGICDGALPLFRKKPLIVVGAGDTAMEESMFLSRYASEVLLVHRRDTLRASKVMQDRVFKNPKIKFLWNSEVIEAKGSNDRLTSVLVKNVLTGEVSEVVCSGLFYAIGHSPNTQFLKGLVDLDDYGYIQTSPNGQTSLLGLYACGDVHDKKYRQAITAAGFGCQVALEVEKYLDEMETI